MSSMILTMAVLGVVGLLAIALTVKKLLYICQPNEVLIFPAEVAESLMGAACATRRSKAGARSRSRCSRSSTGWT